eukprot:scaffold202213_cov24-Tisochrysis_lutea.AAC.1
MRELNAEISEIQKKKKLRLRHAEARRKVDKGIFRQIQIQIQDSNVEQRDTWVSHHERLGRTRRPLTSNGGSRRHTQRVKESLHVAQPRAKSAMLPATRDEAHYP